MNKNFTTGKKLTKFLESEKSQSFRDDNFFGMFEIEKTGYNEIPYWLEKYSNNDNYICEYQAGYYENLTINESTIEHNSKNYLYVDSISLSEEVEHQANNGDLVYEYRGFSFLRIFKKIN